MAQGHESEDDSSVDEELEGVEDDSSLDEDSESDVNERRLPDLGSTPREGWPRPPPQRPPVAEGGPRRAPAPGPLLPPLPLHERSTLADASLWSASSTSRVRPSRLATRLAAPVLSARDAESLLSHPGAPPRAPRPAAASAGDAALGEGQPLGSPRRAPTFEPKVKVPRMRRLRLLKSESQTGLHGLSSMYSVQQDGAAEDDSTVADEDIQSTGSSRRPDVVLLGGTHLRRGQAQAKGGAASKQGSIGGRTSCSLSRELRPPPQEAIAETLYGRGLLGKSCEFRSDCDEAFRLHSASLEEQALHRQGCRRAAQELHRRKAALWREGYERKRQVCELRWRCRDASVRERFGSGSPGQHEQEARHPPTPHDERSADAAPSRKGSTAHAADVAEPSLHTVHHKFSAILRQPLAQRMRLLRKIAKQRRQESRAAAQEELSDSGGEARGARRRSHDGASDVSGVASGPAAGEPGTVSPLATPPPCRGAPGDRSASVADAGVPGGPSVSSRPSAIRRHSQVHRGPSRASLANAAADQTAVAQAFARHDADGSGSLDHSELMECLAELGMRPKTEDERSEVHRVVLDLGRLQFSFKEFSTEILPEVRRRLAQVREPKVAALWREIEEASAIGSTITVEDALTELGKRAVFLGPSARDEALKALAREIGHDERVLPVHRTWLDVERFRSLFRIVQERHDVEQIELFQRISKQHGLSQEDQETWRYELIELWRQFHENDPYRCRFGSPSGSLDDQQIAAVLRHSGYLQHIPRHVSKPLTVSNLVNKAVRSDRTLGFPQFLEVCLALRELDRERLRRLIDTHATGRSGVIDRHELPELLVKCGVVADDVVRSWEVAAEIEDCGLGGSGLLSREDVVILSQRISLKLRAAQRELERQYMVAVGWSAERVAECRRAFEQFDESMGDVLTESELLKAVEVGKGRYAPLVRDLDVAFLALSLDTSVEVRVDFLTFMRIMKMLDESEARRGMAGMLGFGDESSDRIIGIYQKLSDQHGFSAAGLPRSVVEQAMLSLLAQPQWIPKVQQTELQILLSSEPATVDFGGLLRFMKALQGMLGGESFEECLEDLLLGVGTVLSDQRERTKQVSTPKAAAPPRRGAAPPAAEPSAPQGARRQPSSGRRGS